MKRAVFLDRDGVINAMCYDPEHGLVDSPLNPGQFQLLPGVGEAINLLAGSGFLRIVVSNQPIIAKGKSTRPLLDAITDKMHSSLAAFGASLDGVYYCLHHPEAILDEYRANCECRKPKPGLICQASREMGIDLSSSFMIGDGLTDVQAGRQVGCTTIWVGDRKCDVCQVMDRIEAVPDLIAHDLLEAAKMICAMEDTRGDIPGYVQNS